jgi:hypothetical protein
VEDGSPWLKTARPTKRRTAGAMLKQRTICLSERRGMDGAGSRASAAELVEAKCGVHPSAGVLGTECDGRRE